MVSNKVKPGAEAQRGLGRVICQLVGREPGIDIFQKGLASFLEPVLADDATGGTVTNPGGGIDRSGNSVGTIDGFGSVIVNGVEWETDGSTVFTVEDDDSNSQDDLDVGDVVVIRGTIDDSTPPTKISRCKA